jgi:organic hydroperoxide reductase OsmC/OhrA
LTEEKFQELALDAKANCPVSKVLQTAEIRLKAVLIS